MWSLSKRNCTLSKSHLSRRMSLFSVTQSETGGCPVLPTRPPTPPAREVAEVKVTVVPIEAIGVVTAKEGNVATRGVSTGAAWAEVVDEKPVDGVKATGLEKEVGQSVEVVVAAEARSALRSGVAMSFLICSGPRAQKALGLGDRMST